MTYNPNFAGKVAINSVQSAEYNLTGSTLTKLTPVKVNASGNLGGIDVAIESDVFAVAGLLNADTVNGAAGSIVTSGRVENVTTSAAVGEAIYISKTGSITSIKPSIGSGGFDSGDFVVRVGIVVKNATNPLNKDVLVSLQIIGQL